MGHVTQHRSLSWWAVIALWTFLLGLVVLRPQHNAFAWDSFGYHLYLPAYIQHGDPALSDKSWVEAARAQYDASSTLYQITERDGLRLIRYPIGLAVLWSPWYLMGHVAAKAVAAPTDGYSTPYQVSVIIGALFYVLFGLFALRKVLLTAFNERVTTITLCLLVFATNYLDQASAGLTGPHVALVSLYAGILLFTIRWHRTFSPRDAAALAALMGLAALVRPTDLVCILLPLFWGDGPKAVLKHRAQLALVAAIMFLVGLPQLLYWKYTTGSFLYDSYANPGEGLDLLAPHTLDVLFSFRKGWYIYTPMMLLATLGLIPLRKAWPAAFRSVLLFFLLNLYLVSSWTCWWYADSFSSRAMVGSYAVMTLPLAALVQWAVERPPRKRIMLSMFALVTVWQLFQYWQFSQGIIHSQRMTKAAYKASLFRLTRPEDMDTLLLVDRSFQALLRGPDTTRYTPMQLSPRLTAIPPSDRDTMILGSDSAERAFRLNTEHPFSPAWRIPYNAFKDRDHAWIRARWRVFVPDTTHVPNGCFVMTSEHERLYAYQTTDLKGFEVSPGWNSITTHYLTPEVRSGDDVLAVYYWSQDTMPILVSGPEIKVWSSAGLP